MDYFSRFINNTVIMEVVKRKTCLDIERRFDCYCKTVLTNKMRDYKVEEARRREKEISLELLWNEVGTYEEQFFVKVVRIDENELELENEELHNALLLLPKDKSQIIIFYYFYGMTDKEISESLNLNRTTVRNRRYSALATLRKLIIGGKYEQT